MLKQKPKNMIIIQPRVFATRSRRFGVHRASDVTQELRIHLAHADPLPDLYGKPIQVSLTDVGDWVFRPNTRLPRIAHNLLFSDTDVCVRLDDRLDLSPKPLSCAGVMNMVEDKVPQLIRTKERLGSLNRINVVRVLL